MQAAFAGLALYPTAQAHGFACMLRERADFDIAGQGDAPFRSFAAV